MKKLSIILACILVAMMSCTKNKEVHPEIGDGNNEIVTVGMKDVHVEYTRTDHARLSKVVFHYCPSDANGNAQQFEAAEMTKKDSFFELTLDDLLKDTIYWYYFELFYNGGNASNTSPKTFNTQILDATEPPTPSFVGLPTVITAEVSEITANSAQCGGEVTDNGGAEVTERGICWGTNINPTMDGSHIATGSGTGAYTAILSDLEVNTIYHVRAYAINEAGAAYGLDREFVTIDSGGGCDCGYVDLGLPSGTFWATCNVGANSPEDYGDYFAWGETQLKDNYNWSTYQYCNGNDRSLTKYCTNINFGYNGFTDNLTILQPGDDAATTILGGEARTPTEEEWQELYNNCTHVWTMQNGVIGRRFTGTNGNTIFLPAAGHHYGSWFGNAGINGSYWSSLLYTDYPSHAWHFGFGSGYYGMSYDYRYYGRSVRAVRSARQN